MKVLVDLPEKQFKQAVGLMIAMCDDDMEIKAIEEASEKIQKEKQIELNIQLSVEDSKKVGLALSMLVLAQQIDKDDKE